MRPVNRPIKVVVVGDGTVGKTCLLIAYTTGSFPVGDYVPTVFENYSGIIECDDVRVSLTLWDTAGQEDYERLRPFSYPGTDCLLLCFSVDNHRSYENVFSKWYPELRHYCPRTPFILVGTKIDVRDNATDQTNQNYITKAQGKKMAIKTNAAKYIECSAKEISGVNEVLMEAVRAVLYPTNRNLFRKCTLL